MISYYQPNFVGALYTILALALSPRLCLFSQGCPKSTAHAQEVGPQFHATGFTPPALANARADAGLHPSVGSSLSSSLMSSTRAVISLKPTNTGPKRRTTEFTASLPQ